MGKPIIKAKLDVVFKKMFTDSQNINVLTSFLADILGISGNEITHVVVENSEIMPEEVDLKFTKFDLTLTTNKGLINVEVQMSNNKDFPDRVLYYWSQRNSSQLKKGDDYSKLRPVISIIITNFKMFDTDPFYSFYTMADLTNQRILTDKCAMHFFELPKLDKVYDVNDKRKLWMQLINAETEEELDMLANTNVPGIVEGVNVIYKMSADDVMRDRARRREMALRDEHSALNSAKAEGRAEGRAEERRNLINMFLKNGIITKEQAESFLNM